MWYRTAKINIEELISNGNLVSTCIVFRKHEGEVEVLLERRGTPPNKHKWCLPGGHVENGEKPIDAAVRELKEESHLTFDPKKLIYIANKGHESGRDKINFIFATEYTGDENIQADSDAEFLQWFNIKKIPSLIWDNEIFIKKALHKIMI